MKKCFFVIVFTLSSIALSWSQEKFVGGEMNIGKDIYGVSLNEKDPIMGISNLSKNVKSVPRPKLGYKPLPILEKDIKVDTARAKGLVLGVLKDKLNNLRSNKDFISIYYIFYPDGRIMNIDYILPKSTFITPKELAKIDKCLRQEIRATFTGNEYKAFPAIHYNAQKWIYF